MKYSNVIVFLSLYWQRNIDLFLRLNIFNYFYSFCYFGIGSDSFYFYISKLSTADLKENVKRKANVSATYRGSLQCHKLKDSFKISLKDENLWDY